MGERPDPRAATQLATHDAPADPRTTMADEELPLVAGRYELLGMLGAGAMGTVYRARDRELDEIVALKVLKQELAAAPGMLERFRREVKLARRVTHRNVARTFDIGDHAGDRYLTMELVEGEGLGARLERKGCLGAGETIDVARDILAGLSAAHAAGVLHRDLKPENVVIARDGRAVITDFGIARAVAEAEMQRTAANGFVGTPAYMAPEQVEGRSDLDGRVDLYALGAMLYELITGETPFPGDSVVAVAAARILKPPPDVRAMKPDTQPSLADAVLKLMARSRDDRYASADEAAAAFAMLATSDPRMSAPPVVPRVASSKSVAVLPLLNLGPADDAYLAEGVTEDLVDLLSVVPQLRVRPRGETLRWNQPSRDVREAGRTLGVDVVVEGSLRRIGEIVRMSVRLVTIEDGFQLWARRFDRAPGHVLAATDEAASAIAHALASERAAHPGSSHVSNDAEAQELYLRGRFLLNRSWRDTTLVAVEVLRKAYTRAPDDVRIAGTFALAVARSAISADDITEATGEVRAAAHRALALDPEQAEARIALGMLAFAQGDPAGTITELARALDVAPNNVDALEAMGRILSEAGAPDIGLPLLEKASAVDPEVKHARYGMARIRALLGDIENIDANMGSLPTEPGDVASYCVVRARMCMWLGDTSTPERLLTLAAGVNLGPSARQATKLIELALRRTMTGEEIAQVDVALPVTPTTPSRRAMFNAKLRAEMALACGRDDEGVRLLQAADEHGLYDVLWLERCPLIARVRDRSEVQGVIAHTRARAVKVVAASKSVPR